MQNTEGNTTLKFQYMYENLSRYMQYCTCGFLGKFFNVSVKDPDFWGEIMSSPCELFLFSFKS
jgi:hypothetical protein